MKAKFHFHLGSSFIHDGCSAFFPYNGDTMVMAYSPISFFPPFNSVSIFWISYWLRKKRGRSLGGSSRVWHREPSSSSNKVCILATPWLPLHGHHLGACVQNLRPHPTGQVYTRDQILSSSCPVNKPKVDPPFTDLHVAVNSAQKNSNSFIHSIKVKPNHMTLLLCRSTMGKRCQFDMA